MNNTIEENISECTSRTMESGLLNAFHDDHFVDGDYSKYTTEPNGNIWPEENDIMGLQLTETLQGILPISPQEEKSDYLENDFELRYSFHLRENNKELQEHMSHIDYMPDTNISSPGLEVISIDPNNYNFESSESTYDESDESDVNDDYDESDIESNCHKSGNRTNSSSVADFESDSDEEMKNISCVPSNTSELMNNSKIVKNEKIIFADIPSNIKGLQSDSNTARNELKESIKCVIKKEIETDSESDIVDVESVPEKGNTLIEILKEERKFSEEFNNLEYEDDLKNDLSWSPKSNANGSAKKASKSKSNQEIQKPTGANGMVNKLKGHKNNKQNSVEKLKSVLGKQFVIPKPGFNHLKNKGNSSNENGKPVKIEVVKDKSKDESNSIKVSIKTETEEITRTYTHNDDHCYTSNRLLSDNDKDTENALKENTLVEKKDPLPQNIPVKRKLKLEEYKRRIRENDCSTFGSSIVTKQNCSKEISTVGNSQKEGEIIKTNVETVTIRNIKSDIPSIKQEPISNIKPENKDEGKEYVNPLIEAKNKVLKMKELRKARQCKLIDSTVSAKVGPVTKILPLEEIVKLNKNKSSEEESHEVRDKAIKLNPDYEEIIIVSVGCNTDVSFPPSTRLAEFTDGKNNKAKEKLKENSPSLLLNNISNTLKKVKSNDNVKISNHSLISSIQDAVIKKSISLLIPLNKRQYPRTVSDTRDSTKTSSSKVKENQEHGEDKIIMHLRKDRVRPRAFTAGTQTQIVPEFPPLELILKAGKGINSTGYVFEKNSYTKTYEENRGKRKSGHSKYYSSDDSSASESSDNVRKEYRFHKKRKSESFSSSEDESIGYRGKTSDNAEEKHRGRQRYRRRKYRSTSDSESKSSSSNEESNRSRSRCRSLKAESNRSISPTSSYSSSHCSSNNRKFQSRNAEVDRYRSSAVAVEERRIVYVGRIETETSKEDLRRRFISYGPIKQITLHYKDTGMKYGFVTFERSQDAFHAIDNGTRDPRINMYDISFGGRRAFCQTSYTDLDGAVTNSLQCYPYFPGGGGAAVSNKGKGGSFDDLLKEVQEKLKNSKKSKT